MNSLLHIIDSFVYIKVKLKKFGISEEYIQLLVEQNVHSVHCASFYLRASKKQNKYYFKLPDLPSVRHLRCVTFK